MVGMADTRDKYLIREVAPESLDCTSSTARSGRGNPDPQIISVLTASEAREKAPHVMGALDRPTTSVISLVGSIVAAQQTISDHEPATRIICYHSAQNLRPPNRIISFKLNTIAITTMPISLTRPLPHRLYKDRPKRKPATADDTKYCGKPPLLLRSHIHVHKNKKKEGKKTPLSNHPWILRPPRTAFRLIYPNPQRHRTNPPSNPCPHPHHLPRDLPLSRSYVAVHLDDLLHTVPDSPAPLGIEFVLENLVSELDSSDPRFCRVLDGVLCEVLHRDMDKFSYCALVRASGGD